MWRSHRAHVPIVVRVFMLMPAILRPGSRKSLLPPGALTGSLRPCLQRRAGLAGSRCWNMRCLQGMMCLCCWPPATVCTAFLRSGRHCRLPFRSFRQSLGTDVFSHTWIAVGGSRKMVYSLPFVQIAGCNDYAHAVSCLVWLIFA